jgi:hypothetical protein
MSVIAADQKYGNWRVLVIDGRHATCICRCGTVRIFNADGLLDGTAARSCGCTRSNEDFQIMKKAEDFARWRREHRRWKPGA